MNQWTKVKNIIWYGVNECVSSLNKSQHYSKSFTGQDLYSRFGIPDPDDFFYNPAGLQRYFLTFLTHFSLLVTTLVYSYEYTEINHLRTDYMHTHCAL